MINVPPWIFVSWLSASKVTSLKLVQLPKHHPPIAVTVDGILMDFSALQLLKAEPPIVCKVSGRVTVVNALANLKAASPMLVKWVALFKSISFKSGRL